MKRLTNEGKYHFLVLYMTRDPGIEESVHAYFRKARLVACEARLSVCEVVRGIFELNIKICPSLI